MKDLIDTDWVVNYLNGREPATTLPTQLEPDGLAISIITYSEYYRGILGSPDPKAAGAQIHERALDLLIASTAIAYDLTMVTSNRRHYDDIPRLKRYQPPR